VGFNIKAFVTPITSPSTFEDLYQYNKYLSSSFVWHSEDPPSYIRQFSKPGSPGVRPPGPSTLISEGFQPDLNCTMEERIVGGENDKVFASVCSLPAGSQIVTYTGFTFGDYGYEQELGTRLWQTIVVVLLLAITAAVCGLLLHTYFVARLRRQSHSLEEDDAARREAEEEADEREEVIMDVVADGFGNMMGFQISHLFFWMIVGLIELLSIADSPTYGKDTPSWVMTIVMWVLVLYLLRMMAEGMWGSIARRLQKKGCPHLNDESEKRSDTYSPKLIQDLFDLGNSSYIAIITSSIVSVFNIAQRFFIAYLLIAAYKLFLFSTFLSTRQYQGIWCQLGFSYYSPKFPEGQKEVAWVFYASSVSPLGVFLSGWLMLALITVLQRMHLGRTVEKQAVRSRIYLKAKKYAPLGAAEEEELRNQTATSVLRIWGYNKLTIPVMGVAVGLITEGFVASLLLSIEAQDICPNGCDENTKLGLEFVVEASAVVIFGFLGSLWYWGHVKHGNDYHNEGIQRDAVGNGIFFFHDPDVFMGVAQEDVAQTEQSQPTIRDQGETELANLGSKEDPAPEQLKENTTAEAPMSGPSILSV